VAYIKEHYTKSEVRIPMRDGIHLFTSIYAPKDQSQRYPILLMRTPYSVAPYGEQAYRSDVGPSALFGRDGYIVVYQDVRGCWMSEGEFVNMRPHLDQKSSPKDIDESTDTFDTIDYLIKQIPNNNGRVGMWGISYPGFYTAAGMIDAHPALKAASPQAPVTDWFTGDDFHHNGALFLPHAFNFLAFFGRPRPEPTQTRRSRGGLDYGTPDGYEFFLKLGALPNANGRFLKDGVPFWNEMMAHATMDEFWKARNLRPHLKNIKPAVMTVGGWYDAENLYGALETYKRTEANSPGGTNVIVMGPWRHGGWARGDGDKLGPVTFGAKTSEYFRENIEFPFFQHYLKDKDLPKLPEAWVFETGANEWRTYGTWPPPNVQKRSIFVRENGGIAFEAPSEQGSVSYDEYLSDPAHPVEYVEQISIGMTGDYMVQDQRPASHRPDVLVYESGPLPKEVSVVGPIDVRFFVSTSGTDSDWVIKLIDVYPSRESASETSPPPASMRGFEQMVRGDVMRGKFRNSLEKPEPFTPGEPAALNFTMNDVAHTFKAGHKIMIQVQSSWFPLVDRNPQKFVDINKATEADFQKATQRVYRSGQMPSHIEFLELIR
jgi:putative CocE/NonD family hydrolase